MKSFAVEFIADNSGKWAGNGVRYETKAEALAYAEYKFSVWTAVREYRVVESPDPVNYRWDNGLVSL